MVSKSEFIKALQDLPADATVEDAIYRLYVLHKIEKGKADIAAGRTLTDEELTRRLSKWPE